MTRPVGQSKPDAPYEGFPLYAHGSGRWAKKVFGRTRYYGPWDDWQGALAKYLSERDYEAAGIEPPLSGETVADLLNGWDAEKLRALEMGELTQVSYTEYVCVTDIMVAHLGRSRPLASLTPAVLGGLRLALSRGKTKALGVATLKRRLSIARSVMKWANDNLDAHIKYEKALAAPPKKLLRQRRAEVGERLFSAKELRDLIAKANPHMKCVIYLGINAAYGPADCLGLTTDRIVDGFASYVRAKSGVQRRCPLWPETLAAINAISDNKHVFNGRKWTRHIVARQFKKLCEDAGIYRENVTTPYSLRRTMQSVAKNADVNQSAIDRIFGHERPEMSEIYNQRVFDKQLLKVTDFVKRWLDGKIKL